MNSTELIKFCEEHGFDPEAYGANYWIKRFEDWEDKELAERHRVHVIHAMIICWIGDKYGLWLHVNYTKEGVDLKVFALDTWSYAPGSFMEPCENTRDATEKGIIAFLTSVQRVLARRN